MDFGKLIETLMYFIPAAIVLGAAYLLVKNFLDNSYRLKLLELKKGMQKDMVPLRLQAYERLILLLERISPNNILVRLNDPNQNARQFQNDLILAIRAEYEHNLTQQLYVSSLAWEMVKMAKEDMVKLVNIASTNVGENGTSIDLSKQVFEEILRTEKMPTYKAIEFLKNEVRELF
ncbi:MAG: hypothetical protein WCL14_14730 [Bacteroidota bacterium]